MHIFFSGIGGAGIGPATLVAKQAGYDVSGSDAKDSQYVQYLRKKGIEDIVIGQTAEQIATVHKRKPIDLFVYTAALSADHPELAFCQQNGIKTAGQYDFINEILSQNNLKLVSIAGTHGKTTTTAMVIWLFKQLDIPISYSVGAKLNFGDMGEFDSGAEYFVAESDEFDRRFLVLKPYLSIISGLAWDHHEIFPTLEDYNQAFRQFISQSEQTVIWDEDAEKLNLLSNAIRVVNSQDPSIGKIKLIGQFNRRDAYLAMQAVQLITPSPAAKLVELMNGFPGLSRRFEKVAENLYSDYAHTPEKIVGLMSVAKEKAAQNNQKIVIVYEPLTNRRMHYLAADHQDVFNGASKIYWVPSYLAREDPNQPVLSPEQLIKNLNPDLQKIASTAKLDEQLKSVVQQRLNAGDLVVALSGGGGGSLDEWLRKNFKA